MVDRRYIIDRLVNNSNLNEEDRKIIDIELEVKGFYSYNESVNIWKINFWSNDRIAVINPIFEQQQLT